MVKIIDTIHSGVELTASTAAGTVCSCVVYVTLTTVLFG